MCQMTVSSLSSLRRRCRTWWHRPSKLTPDEREILIKVTLLGYDDWFFFGDAVDLMNWMLTRAARMPEWHWLLPQLEHDGGFKYSNFLYGPHIRQLAAAILKEDATHWGNHHGHP
jgi:hypothetical protein